MLRIPSIEYLSELTSLIAATTVRAGWAGAEKSGLRTVQLSTGR
jgi:hypothetical protein